MKNNRGMALVVALLTSFILLALVASLFWVIASTSRQAEYAKNSAIALNLAEAGTADAIYRLNYCGTDGIGSYPFDNTFFPLSGVSGDTSILLISLPANIFPNPPPVSLCIQGTLNGGNYYVGLIDDPTGADTIITVGVYKGIRRILTVPLRGNNVVGPRQEITASNQGISEAFNKHAIYADTVTAIGTTTVNGNIAYKNPSTFPILGAWTKTIVAPELFALPVPNPVPVAVSDPDPGIPTASLANTKSFKDNDGLGSPYTGAVGYESTFPGDPGGYSGTTGAEIYILNSSCTINTNEVWRFEKFSLDPAVSLTVTINAAALSTINGKIVVMGGSVEIVGSSADYVVGNASPGQVTIWAENTIDIRPGSGILTINGDAYCRGGSTSGIRISPDGNGRINGWLKSGGIIYVASTNTVIGQPGIPTGLIAAGKITLAGGTIYGGVSSSSGLDITGAVTIDSSASDTALLVSSAEPGPATVTISATPTLTLGPNQTAALSVFSATGNTQVTVSAPFVPEYDNAGQSAIVAYAYDIIVPKTSLVNLNAPTGAVDNGRPIYSYGGAGTGITTGTIVYGSLITNGTVTLNPGSILTYDPSAFTSANPGSDIFAGFSGGRRAYVPAWKGWRLR